MGNNCNTKWPAPRLLNFKVSLKLEVAQSAIFLFEWYDTNAYISSPSNLWQKIVQTKVSAKIVIPIVCSSNFTFTQKSILREGVGKLVF